MYFDSHAHYNDERFDEDRERLLSQLKEKNVDYVLNAGADVETSKQGIALGEQYDYIYAGVGVHPHDVAEITEEDIKVLKELSTHKKVVAIGEIGLDYYYEHSPKDLQRKWFQAQLELAKEVDLPVIIHSRDACQETLDLIKESGLTKGVIHCFSGSKEIAKEYIKLGFYIGIGGTVTFKNAKKTVEVVKAIPLERIVIETDCPYLTPVPHRGKRNDSSYLVHVVDKIAEITGQTHEEVALITKNNAKTLYTIDEEKL